MVLSNDLPKEMLAFIDSRMLTYDFPSGEFDTSALQGYSDCQVFFYQNTQSFLLPHAIVGSSPPSLWVTARKQRDRLISSLTKKTASLGKKQFNHSQVLGNRLTFKSPLLSGEMGRLSPWSQSAAVLPRRPHKCLAKHRLSGI